MTRRTTNHRQRLCAAIAALLAGCGTDTGPGGAVEAPVGAAIAPLVGVQQAKLVASNGKANDFFGNKVVLSGDTALVGASADSVAGGAS
ncbi:FG-GAP repeat protein [Polyangium sp. y55x31]|uniref:FG-GAP repeat protein n=1 Tax=Polyangium sp. y55x31 TaxID=3042688 RepID=UPI002482EBE2|nr:FG-GAP repeat protein [Polyangium sp. y55x31]MDI1476088.1 FG-GAP repeat protein [Polyangium sp. y55x31]